MRGREAGRVGGARERVGSERRLGDRRQRRGSGVGNDSHAVVGLEVHVRQRGHWAGRRLHEQHIEAGRDRLRDRRGQCLHRQHARGERRHVAGSCRQREASHECVDRGRGSHGVRQRRVGREVARVGQRQDDLAANRDLAVGRERQRVRGREAGRVGGARERVGSERRLGDRRQRRGSGVGNDSHAVVGLEVHVRQRGHWAGRRLHEQHVEAGRDRLRDRRASRLHRQHARGERRRVAGCCRHREER